MELLETQKFYRITLLYTQSTLNKGTAQQRSLPPASPAPFDSTSILKVNTGEVSPELDPSLRSLIQAGETILCQLELPSPKAKLYKA